MAYHEPIAQAEAPPVTSGAPFPWYAFLLAIVHMWKRFALHCYGRQRKCIRWCAVAVSIAGCLAAIYVTDTLYKPRVGSIMSFGANGTEGVLRTTLTGVNLAAVCKLESTGWSCTDPTNTWVITQPRVSCPTIFLRWVGNTEDRVCNLEAVVTSYPVGPRELAERLERNLNSIFYEVAEEFHYLLTAALNVLLPALDAVVFRPLAAILARLIVLFLCSFFSSFCYR